MLKKTLFVGFVLCCFSGCASHKMAPGETQNRLRHQLPAGETRVYSIKSVTTDSMKLMGKEHTSTTRINSQYSHHPLSKLADKQTLVQITLDSLQLTSDNPDLSSILVTFEDAINRIINNEMQARISDLGAVEIQSPIDSLIPTRLLPFINPKHSILLSFPEFSKSQIKPEEKWETVFQYKRKAPGLKSKTKCQITNRLEKIITWDSTRIAHIQVTGIFEITGQGRQLNTLSRTEGTGTIAGHYRFDVLRGRFLGGEFAERIKLNYFFPGIESQPVTQMLHSQTSIKLK